MNDEELDYYVEMDGYDPDTGDELPEQYELNDKIIKGDLNARKIVKDTYANINSFYGKYIINYSKWYSWYYLILYFVILATLAMSLAIYFTMNIFPYLISIMWALCFAIILILKFSFKYDMYFYKAKGKALAVYKSRFVIKICLSKDEIYQFRFNKWKKLDYWHSNLGSRPVFSMVVGRLKLKNKKNITVIMSGKDGAYLKFVDNKLVSMGYKESTWKKVIIKEINTNRYVDIPKSFKKFCEANDIDPLSEWKYIEYV